MGTHAATGPAKTYITKTLAEWAASVRFEDLSPQAIHAAKLFLFDSVGCALGGSRQPDVKMMLDYTRACGAPGAGSNSGGGSNPIGKACNVFVFKDKANPVAAALLNAHMIRAMDYNDIYWKADPCHPSDIIPAATSACEIKGTGGKELICATLVAYEIEQRLCEIGIPGIREYGWHHATFTAFAAAATAGRGLALSPEKIQHAIGIAGSANCTLGAVTAGKLTNMKNTVDPMSTRAGVEAAILAGLGYSGPEHVIDGKEGLTHVFKHEWNLAGLTDHLPHCPKCHWRILDCGMKSFPIEALSHAPLTAMFKALAQAKKAVGEVKHDDVTEIKVEVIARAADILGDPHKYRPDSKETADHSLPYCLAVGLMDGMVTPLQFEEERIKDARLIPLMDKIKVMPNEEFEALFPKFQPSRVTITLKNGKSFAERVDVPKGDPRDPMTEEEIAVKFTALGAPVIGAERCAALRKCIMAIEHEATLDRMFELSRA